MVPLGAMVQPSHINGPVTVLKETAMSDSLEQKIAKLLAKAERTDNAHEAEAFSRAAERLMLKWSIDEAVIRSRMGADQKPESIVTKNVGPFPKLFVKARTGVAACVVNGMGNMKVYLTTHSDGQVTVRIMGFESDVDRAIILVNSIVLQADSAMRSWWKDYPMRKAMKSSDALKARRQFLFSFGLAVQARLKEMRAEEVQVSAKKEPGTELVLMDRGQQVDAEFNKLRLRRGRGVKGSAYGAAEGHAAGQRANLGARGLGGSRGAIGG